ncbi:DUF1963 domain-containing protein [Candidatus Contendibacter odensensis]|uniref:DUF1963 domain-containing protein n=1 Tax=Candidatus Contendobacter odensis Run_B_J11 TaxID=1400861 RepID=A0A7U7GER5_9GAMM|nr:DUF1963 domain-containing protein [Candidatus Contendobacter odensis]MBK8755430.1 DUF1963 domain-containing protein [Candidatus Competibacteraceae bacterium]CDH46914.1 conserved hypothetical protein [Candidatus Contendobacter odensis Run_B_J11]
MPHASRLQFREATAPISDVVTKFGGQPAWLEDRVVPLSRRTGKPMTFIAQVLIPAHWLADDTPRMAYIFMTGAGFDHNAMETWDPNEGETAVVIQTKRANSPACEPYPEMLCCWEERDNPRREVPCEYAVDETPVEETAYVPQEELDRRADSEREPIVESWRGNKIGGSPYWIQYEEFPFDDWRLLLQLEDGAYPFNLNLGTGIGYVFLNAACTEGKLLWQC